MGPISLGFGGTPLDPTSNPSAQDSLSAIVFRTPGRCSAVRVTSLLMHRSLTTLFSLGDTVPPNLSTYETANVLSNLNSTVTLFLSYLNSTVTLFLSYLNSTVTLFLSLTKHFTGWKAANAFRQLICHSFSSGDHGPPVQTPLHVTPHP